MEQLKLLRDSDEISEFLRGSNVPLQISIQKLKYPSPISVQLTRNLDLSYFVPSMYRE